MLTKEEKQEGIDYQVTLIKKDETRERKGHLSLIEREKITYADPYACAMVHFFGDKNPELLGDGDVSNATEKLPIVCTMVGALETYKNK